MPIAATDLLLFCSASRPLDDVSTTGGAISTDTRPEFTDFSATAVIALVSDGADTRSVDCKFRNAAGAIVNETLVLNGTTEVLSSASAERLLSIIAQTTSATRIVSVKQGAGGTVRGTIPVNEKGFAALFIDSKSESGATTRWEKVFYKNNHGSLTLSNSIVTLTADPAAKLRIGLESALNDTDTVANRKTDPVVTEVDDNVDASVPNSGNMLAGDRIGVWVELQLVASDLPQKNSWTLRLQGTSA